MRLPSLEWQLRKIYENSRIENKFHIARNAALIFSELEILEWKWETELAKLKIRGQQLGILDKNNHKNDKSKKDKGND